MKEITRIFAVLFLLAISSVSLSEEALDNIPLKPIIVTATRIRSSSISNSTRSSGSDESLLLNDSLVDSRTRGPYGIQDDVSIRGASFEQTAVLLNGVRLNDPQTGHFHMDIPLTVLDVDRLDIAYGPSSGYYGSSGIGGTVNILAVPPGEDFGVKAEVETGSYDYYSGAVSMDMPLGRLKNKVSYEESRSSGYRKETEFNKRVLNVNSNFGFDRGYFDFLFGYMLKDFGAGDFYSESFDNEQESTDTRLMKLDAAYDRDDITFMPKLYYRRHWDKFILDRNREDWSKNIHTNYVYGGELGILCRTGLGELVYGIDVRKEKVDSTSLEKHTRYYRAFFLEHNLSRGPLQINTGTRLDHYSSFGAEFNPNIGLAYDLNDKWKARASAGGAFRAPSFTELYYRSSANVGNPDLEPEESWSYDLGLDFESDWAKMGLTGYLRYTDRMIDWTRSGSSGIWYAENIGEFNVYGIEAVMEVMPCKIFDLSWFKNVKVRYGYTEDFERKGITSKYVTRYLMHDFTAEIIHDIIWGFRHDLVVKFKNRRHEKPYVLLDSRLCKNIKTGNLDMEIFLEGDNLLNTDYKESGWVRMPGLQIRAGVKWGY